MVTRDTPWLPGTPSWVDVTVDDVPKAVAFYQALFGWDIQSGGPETGGYSICHSGGHIVAGLSPKFGPGEAPSVWTIYLAADDTDAAAAKVKAAGGHPLVDPTTSWTPAGWRSPPTPPGPRSACGRAVRTAGSGWPTRPGALTWERAD